jgi:transposase
MTDQDKDIEILVLRHQIALLQRQLGDTKVRFGPTDRALLAALLHRLPRQTLRRLRLLVRPDTILRWHRDILRRRHAKASRPKRPGRPRTIRSIRILILRLAKENPSWGYRRIHGELLVLGIKVAASTVWQILTDAGIDPAPKRASSTWAQFLHSQAEVLLACAFLETITLTGVRMYVLVVIEHAQRRNPHPRRDTTSDHGMGNPGCAQPRHGPRRRRPPSAIHDPRQRRQIPPPIRSHPHRRRNSGRPQRYPDAQDELDHRAMGTDLPPRTARPHTDLEPTTPTPRTPPIRAVLQQPQATPRHRQRPTTTTTARADHRPSPDHPARHPPTPTVGRHPQRVPPCRLTSADDIFGKCRVPFCVLQRSSGQLRYIQSSHLAPAPTITPTIL